jgi:uncharacterized protein
MCRIPSPIELIKDTTFHCFAWLSMLIVLSPAKTLDYDTKLPSKKFTEPAFLEQSSQLVHGLKNQTSLDLQQLMGISPDLAQLNCDRFNSWRLPFNLKNARQAIFAFNGDVYDGLQAKNLSSTDLNFAQKHIRILSGLYGTLKPLDLMQPYRLEMGTRWANSNGKDLYEFWGDKVSQTLQIDLQNAGGPLLVNLASEEYFKVVRADGFSDNFQPKLITPIFEDWSSGKFKVVSFFAKKARGAMARFIVQGRIKSLANLKTFAADGYYFDSAASKQKDADKKLSASLVKSSSVKRNQFADASVLVFRRKI